MVNRDLDIALFGAGRNIGAAVMRHISTNTGIHDALVGTVGGGSRWIKGSSGHFARDNMKGWKVADANWGVAIAFAPSDGTEVGPGAAALSIERWVEYPIGTFTRIQWSASNSGSIPVNTTVWSDAIGVAIPDWAYYRLHYMVHGTDGILYSTICGDNTNRMTNNTGTTTYDPVTQGGAISLQAAGWLPAAIIGPSRKPAYNLCGTSLVKGNNDSADSSTNRGMFARPIGTRYGHANLGVPSDRATYVNTKYAKRAALCIYGTHTLSDFGINDIGFGGNAATTLAALATWYGLAGIVGKPIFQTTLTPFGTTTTDAFVTEGNQTVAASNTEIQVFNAAQRDGGIAGVHGCIDVARVFESPTTPGKWMNVYGRALCHADGTHYLPRGYRKIQSDGVVHVAMAA